jgi:hypothetical protein
MLLDSRLNRPSWPGPRQRAALRLPVVCGPRARTAGRQVDRIPAPGPGAELISSRVLVLTYLGYIKKKPNTNFLTVNGMELGDLKSQKYFF